MESSSKKKTKKRAGKKGRRRKKGGREIRDGHKGGSEKKVELYQLFLLNFPPDIESCSRNPIF